MEQLVQCPVCTLFLHNGMTLESHLDTHPKDQVIKALCSLSVNRGGYGSRSSTPMHSERSYRSRSRTPATEDGVKWSPSMGGDSERYWRRSASRTPRTSNSTRSVTPASNKVDENSYDSSKIGNSVSTAYSSRKEKILHQPYTTVSTPLSAFDPQYSSQDKEENEIKYSRSQEYSNSLQSTNNNAFVYMPPVTQSGMRFQNSISSPPKRFAEIVNMVPTNSKQDFIKIPMKTNNIALVKTNVGSLQYIAPGMMMAAEPTNLQHKSQKNILMAANANAPNMIHSKTVNSLSNQFNQITSSTFAPNTTVVTQNSQIIYRGVVHNIDGKQLIPGLPQMLGTHENVTNVAQTSSVYQNVMVLDQYGNSSCMYATPQQMLSKPPPMYNANIPAPNLDKNLTDSAKTLIIEVGPIDNPMMSTSRCDASTSTSTPLTEIPVLNKTATVEPVEPPEVPVSNKGLKILSNIKVEVPVQHHKNLLNKVVDLTGPVECDYPNRPETPERILPDIENTSNRNVISVEHFSPSSSDTQTSNTLSVIKNVGNPPSYKDSKSQSSQDKLFDMQTESDSCPVPDLICNEKPSVSPCSELSENGDNAQASISPKLESIRSSSKVIEPKKELSLPIIRTSRNNPLRLNNIFVKKNKKVLQIKNSKSFPLCSNDLAVAGPSQMPTDFTMNKVQEPLAETSRKETLVTVSIEKLNESEDHDFDADTEEQSMDLELEPVEPSDYHPSNYSTIDLTNVKDEGNSSNEFSNETITSDRQFEMESMRPVNIQYGNIQEFDDDSDHRELLDLEAASKTKQFVSMMNDNYFGDNIYADYFTPDRVESFDARETSAWGESSQKVSEFVLPNFIDESYKITEGSGYMGREGMESTGREGADSKADVLSDDCETPLNICADERMPPRGELSGQESNGDMDASWSGMYQEVTATEPYDLMARESWVSDASDLDSNDKRDSLEDEVCKTRLFICVACGLQFGQMKELRLHRATIHAGEDMPATSRTIITHRIIKKEEKTDDMIPGIPILDSKPVLPSNILEVYDVMNDAKPKIETIIKQETKRRRRDYVCPTCKVDQLTDVAFHEHLKIHPLECLTCGKCFFRRANLALHIKNHLGIKNYKCELCEKRFVTRQKLSEHHNTHTGRAPVKCTLCDRAFRRYSNMVQHRDRYHFNKRPKIRDFVCHCGEVYHSRAKLNWHKETHDGKPKACQYCSDKFVHMSSLTRHVRRMHNSYYIRDDLKKNENVPCPICKQVYLRSNLKTHMRTHSGKRPYSCVICNKSFTTQWNLKHHRWTHMSRSSKPFKCTICKGAFVRQSDYISHMNAHKSVKPYTCNYCGCQFIRKYNCLRHVKEHELSKKYVCKVPDCGKSFHRSYYLAEHMKVHSGARPFSCNICGKTSSNKSNHNKHVKIHHAREPVATEA